MWFLRKVEQPFKQAQAHQTRWSKIQMWPMRQSLQLFTWRSSTWEKYDTRKLILMFLHIGRQSRFQTPQRCRRGQMLNKLQMWTRKKERERCCELVWCLKIMCIFSHEPIEKSSPQNLQEPNSWGKDNREKSEKKMWMRTMEREGYCELIWCSNVTWFLSWSLIKNHFSNKMLTRGIVWVLKCNMVPEVIVDSKYHFQNHFLHKMYNRGIE